MKKTKKILSILLSCLMLMSLLSVGVFAAQGTQDNPIVISKTALGEVSYYFCNTTLTAGDTDGVWYTFTAEDEGIMAVDCLSYDMEFRACVWVNGVEYADDTAGVITRPITTYPVTAGDTVVIQIVAKDMASAGYIYANVSFYSGKATIDGIVPVKSAGAVVYVAAGATVNYQDNSTNAEYALQGLQVSGESVEGVSISAASKTYTDSDGDGMIELKLGGSLGSAGSPPVKPNWAITNASDEDKCLILTISDPSATHECNWDNDADADCNTCGAIREVAPPAGCAHEYFYPCDATCMICGELTNPEAAHSMTYVEAVAATCTVSGNIAFYTCEYCGGCWDNEQAMGMPLNQMMIVIPATGEHTYDHDFDADCNACGEIRFAISTMPILGTSVSEDVNGLAIQVKANIGGIQADGKTAIYDEAFVNDFKLVSMGAVVSNDGSIPSMETVDNNRVLNIPAVYLSEFNAETDSYYYTIRIVNIPEDQKSTTITFRSYFIYENSQGAQQIVYDDVLATSYNAASVL